MKNIQFEKFVIFADVSIFLEITEQRHVVTKIMLLGDAILISDTELSSKGDILHWLIFPSPNSLHNTSMPPSSPIWGISGFGSTVRSHLAWNIHKFC